ncbi:MAG TPA: hypothetical protein VHH33_06645 [Nitrososphaeraceae archaeon]|jgi:hypothetical protein|nr:hypothetical protein [Nitrososphaeraceae archaeon]
MTNLIIKYLVDRKVSSQYKNLITATLKHACEINDIVLNWKKIKKFINSESYYFGYTASPDKFNTSLPIAQQVLKTLQICQLTESEKSMHAKRSCLEEMNSK